MSSRRVLLFEFFSLQPDELYIGLQWRRARYGRMEVPAAPDGPGRACFIMRLIHPAIVSIQAANEHTVTIERAIRVPSKYTSLDV